MATGHYQLSGYFDDEYASDVNDFFLPETHAEKMNFAVNQYPRQASRHTDALSHQRYVFSDGRGSTVHRDKVGYCGDVFEDVVVNDIWAPLGLMPAAFQRNDLRSHSATCRWAAPVSCG